MFRQSSVSNILDLPRTGNSLEQHSTDTRIAVSNSCLSSINSNWSPTCFNDSVMVAFCILGSHVGFSFELSCLKTTLHSRLNKPMYIEQKTKPENKFNILTLICPDNFIYSFSPLCSKLYRPGKQDATVDLRRFIYIMSHKQQVMYIGRDICQH